MIDSKVTGEKSFKVSEHRRPDYDERIDRDPFKVDPTDV